MTTTDIGVDTTTAPSHAQLIQMATAYWVSRAVYATAKLGLADHLAGGPKTASELATLTRTHAPSLHRLLRTQASLGILAEDGQHRFGLTPLGDALRSGAPGSARATILALAGDWWWRGWEHILYCLETGETGMRRASGTSIFEYLAGQPQEASYFNEAMIGFHGAEPAAVAEAYDFSACGTVVDVGGGTGNLLAAILERHPGVRAVLADLPHVIEEAPGVLATRGVLDRVTCHAIDFFADVPQGGDVYLLSHIIHDWTEDQCVAILGNCRRAMGPTGRLLIVEMVLPDGNAPHPGKLLDLAMLVMPGGQERTEAEYAALLGRAGFELRRVVSTRSAVSVVEARPAGI
jgi:SAM-dependent methyltransferase